MKYAIGVDIGGTTIASGIVNQNGDVIQQETVKSDSFDRENMFAQVVLCIEKLLDHSSIPICDIHSLGAGVPGKVDREKGIAIFQNNLPWNNFPFIRRIREAFELEHVAIDNDVHMAAFAEWKKAQLKQDELFVYMTISTGISSAIIQDGEFMRGAGFAGEAGLIPVYTRFPENTLRRLEMTASGPAIAKHSNDLYGRSDMTAKEVFKAFDDDDSIAQMLIKDIAASLAQGIYTINSLLDPHKIVFGGSVVSQNPVLLTMVKTKLEEWLLDEQTHILDHMEVSYMGNEQGIIGAGLRALENREEAFQDTF
ncbi:ROK family protein [Lentibacillus sp. CBA3610]|uniref:ROK family protein n=1 Tax=Lentibacillus sp. CBA3610 TaxID=2518176 RepID=UPI001595D136|nr:ROK family protein [Lentibacillus sp. CBA3610]QKY70353.1 ROK family protein [Lentibacillus sp. CBA3610]